MLQKSTDLLYLKIQTFFYCFAAYKRQAYWALVSSLSIDVKTMQGVLKLANSCENLLTIINNYDILIQEID